MAFWNKTEGLPTQTGEERVSPTFTIAETHHVNGNSITGPYPAGMEVLYVGMGCFWGAERLFWQLSGVYSTSVGYQGGTSPYPTYQETCSGSTGHTEAVKIVFDPEQIELAEILKVFWEEHNPTQGMRQGNDVGSQYRSAIFTTSDEQLAKVLASKDAFETGVTSAGYPSITTEIGPADTFYYAEEYHQQYLAKNPGGYCGLKGTGVTCSI